jgi:serine/threonine-protein kinase
MAFEAGQRIGDYEIVAQLGVGGLGMVYEVQHLISQRREAMKILLPDQLGAAEMVERFRREVQTLASLNHVNIAALHTAFYYENQLAMVMELVHGETLRDRHRRAAISQSEVLNYATQTLHALVYAHRLGVVHRDIKPSNIMITDTGVVKLLDFGIALTSNSSHLTVTGYLLGSLSYMSPEQLMGSVATAQSDIYSVGVTLYELLTGALPITGSTNYEIMLGHMQRVPVPPHEVATNVPLVISAAVMRSLAKKPEDRFATAEEFLHAMQLAPASAAQAVALSVPAPMQAAKPAGIVSSRHTATGEPKLPSGSGQLSLPLEELSRKLAVYIGPVARFVVKKLAAQHEDLDEIYREAAKQIASDADRAAFLRSKSK